MNVVTTDVDIDVFNREQILDGLEYIFGRIDRKNGNYDRHTTGVYFQNIPRDPTTNISTLDHRIANDYGYFKIDFLNVNFYEKVKDEKHLLELIDRDPPWDFFEYAEITDKLFQLNGHSELLRKYKPQSVQDLAVILAIIRPAKAHLQNKNWETILEEVWTKDNNDVYGFKKSHATSYAVAVVVNLNLMIEDLTAD